VDAARELPAWAARAARDVAPAAGPLAVRRLREQASGRRLADAGGPAEQVRVVKRAATERGAKRGDGAILRDELRERHDAARKIP